MECVVNCLRYGSNDKGNLPYGILECPIKFKYIQNNIVILYMFKYVNKKKILSKVSSVWIGEQVIVVFL